MHLSSSFPYVLVRQSHLTAILLPSDPKCTSTASGNAAAACDLRSFKSILSLDFCFFSSCIADLTLSVAVIMVVVVVVDKVVVMVMVVVHRDDAMRYGSQMPL